LFKKGSNTGITVGGSPSDPGSWSYQFSSPTSIIFDPYGYMYILDTGNSRVQKWYPGGSFGTTIISTTMSSPSGLKLDLFSNIVIADRGYHRILSFAMTCRKLFLI
jgi:tripartite motif-containing protein 71